MSRYWSSVDQLLSDFIGFQLSVIIGIVVRSTTGINDLTYFPRHGGVTNSYSELTRITKLCNVTLLGYYSYWHLRLHNIYSFKAIITYGITITLDSLTLFDQVARAKSHSMVHATRCVGSVSTYPNIFYILKYSPCLMYLCRSDV